MATLNKRFVLASRPSGEPTAQNFRLEEVPLPALNDGEVLVRHHYLSLDPYMRGRMSEGKSYAQPQPLNAVMIGGTVGEVVESRHPGYQTGDKVVGMGGWQQYAALNASQPGVLRKVDTSRIPISAYLGATYLYPESTWAARGLQGAAQSYLARNMAREAGIALRKLVSLPNVEPALAQWARQVLSQLGPAVTSGAGPRR